MIEPPFQWRVVRAQLDPIRGSEQAGTRPVLIISSEAVNEVLSIVTVLPMTTLRSGRRIYPTEVLLPAYIAGQPNDSVIMAHQIRTLAKERLLEIYGFIEDSDLRVKVRQALRNHLDLN